MQATGLTAWELFCRRGDRELFHGIDLWVDRGGALHLVGRNGIGKSSMIRMLAGLLKPTWSPEVAAAAGGNGYGIINWVGSVGIIDQRPALDEHLPLGKALGFWCRLDRRNDPPLERLGLSNLADVPVRYLSTGQRKRAAFARLLGQGADNWLLDEPLNGLDTQGVELVEDLIAEHRAGGGVVIVASHQPIDLPGAQVIDVSTYPH
jgi:heme exporter protein A